MAEEEQGFTFVDKRGGAVDAAAESSAPIDAEPADPSAPIDEDMTDARPDIYSIVGYCLSLLASEAWQKLGLIADPSTGEAQADLAQAKVAIDAAGDLGARLEAAPEGVVSEAMKRDLRTLLQDLRLNYVAQQEHAKSE